MMLLTLPGKYYALMGSIIVGGIVLLIVLLKLRRKSKRIGNIGLSLWMICAFLVLVEIGFAGFYDTTDSFNRTNVSRRWFQNHYESHSDKKVLQFQSGQGVQYRSATTFPADTSNRNHVCFLGDSFTFGHGVVDVKKRFSDQLAASLKKSRPDEFIVSNLSNPGTDLVWVQSLLGQLFDDGHKIDTAVYVACLNDIEVYSPDHLSIYSDIGKHDPKFTLFSDTYFFNLVYFRAKQFTLPEIRDYYAFVKDYYEGKPWQQMSNKLLQTAQLCKENDSEFKVVLFPFLHNCGEDYPFRNVHQQLVEFCQANDISVVDLEPIYREKANERLTVNPFDAHPNEYSHSMAAKAIEESFFSTTETSDDSSAKTIDADDADDDQ